MSAHVLLNLLNMLEKRDKMRGLQSILSLFTTSITNLIIMFCFTFVSDHNTDYIMLYSVQLKNMYSYLNSSLKLSDIVRGLSCQQSYCNLFS